ncbi:MAG: PKD domain-containing protein [bacterium]|nr:PKD domain-containing protein [bacterium]
MKRSLTLIATLFILTLIIGCSGSSNAPVAPDTDSPNLTLTGQDSAASEYQGGEHALLGFGQCIVDPDSNTMEIVPMRTSEFHLNMVKFVESSPTGLTIDGPLAIESGILKLKLAIKHPLEGLDEYSVFDTKLVFITPGNVSGFSDTDIVIAGPGTCRLENADGLTRYWNPKEFIMPSFRGYTPGKLGLNVDPASSSILNGYKLYADGFAPTATLADLDPATRAFTQAGNTNSRYCEITIGSSFVFNYAMDACWGLPIPCPPDNLPGDFPIAANQAEPWWIDVTETNNTLWYKSWDFGGNVNYDITIHDWQGSGDFGAVTIDCPGIFTQTSSTPESTTATSATYHFDVILPVLPSSAGLDVLVSVGVSGDYDSALTGVTKPLKAYTRHLTEVSDTKPINNLPPVPVMVATTETTIPSGEAVSFDASDSYDPDGMIVDYEWDFNGDGSFSDTYTGDPTTPSHIYETPGVFQAKVKVTDNSSGAVISDPVEITVNNGSNQNPVAIAEANTNTHIIEGGSVSFDGTASYDPDGSIYNWKWDFNGDGNYNDTYTGDASTPTKTFDTPGTYNVDMMAIDNESAFDVLDTKIQIIVDEGVIIPPVADAVATTATTIYAGETVTFDATGSSDADGTVIEWRWDFNGDGNYNDTFSGTMDNPTHTFSAIGTFMVDLRVFDDDGGTDTLDTKIQVDVIPSPNIPPVALAHATTDTNIGGCSSVSFDAWDSYDPDGMINTFQWDFNGDGTFGDTYQSGSIKSPTVDFNQGGVFEVQLRVVDNDGAEDFLDIPITVTVANIGPTASAVATTATTILNSESVTFNASASVDPDCDNITAYDWDFNADGVYGDSFDSGTAVNPTKIFMTIGVFNVSLRVTDASAATDIINAPIVVTVNNHPPVACAEVSDTWPYLWNEDHNFSADCAEDIGGSITLYEWDLNADGSYEQTGPDATYYFGSAGEYVIQLRVTDNLGLTDILDTPLVINIYDDTYDDTNVAPVINEVIRSRTTSYIIGEPVSLSVDYIDTAPAGDKHIFLWTCPVGSFNNSSSPTPIWTPPTTATETDITVTITDLNGAGFSVQGSCHQWVTSYAKATGNPLAPNGSELPPGVLTDYFDDEVFQITDYIFPNSVNPDGNVVYINVWASWCGPCIGELPHLMQIYQNWKNEDFAQIEISIDNSASALATFLANNPQYNVNTVTHWVYDYPPVYWPKIRGWQAPANQGSIPQHYIFDRDGVCRFVGIGSISGPTAFDPVLNQLL